MCAGRAYDSEIRRLRPPPVPGPRLDQIYRERLVQIERLDAVGFSAYHLAEHHMPAIHSLDV